jgi:arylsulfatase
MQPVELRDVLPMFLDAASIPAGSGSLDGRSLLTLIRGDADGWRKYLDLEHDVCFNWENHWNARSVKRYLAFCNFSAPKNTTFSLEMNCSRTVSHS